VWFTITSDSWHPGGLSYRFRPTVKSFKAALYAQTFPPFWRFPGEESVRWKWLGEAMPPLYARHLFTRFKTKGKLLDLFAGIGGWGLGFVLTGNCHYIEMVEIDRRKCQYLEINFKELRRLVEGHVDDFEFNVIRGDVRDYEPSEKFDVITASPPCEDYSVLRALSLRYGVELKGTLPLTRWYLEFIREQNPPLALYENVPSNKIREVLSRYGWRVEVHDMSSVIPQRRRRIIAIYRKSAFITPEG